MEMESCLCGEGELSPRKGRVVSVERESCLRGKGELSPRKGRVVSEEKDSCLCGEKSLTPGCKELQVTQYQSSRAAKQGRDKWQLAYIAS